VKNHHNGGLNPEAHFKNELKVEQVRRERIMLKKVF
jgi:acetyl-CoA acetyltransferase